MGGGVASFDCNDDGLTDLYFAGGESAAELFVNHSPTGRALSFAPLASPVTDLNAVTGAYPIDVDGDGITDLAVLRHGENELLRGLGNCQFERANENGVSTVATTGQLHSAPSGTEERAWPTVAVGNYLTPANASNIRACVDDELYTPSTSGGGFSAATPLSPSWCTLSLLFTDWDRSGRRDLRVSNDRHYYGETTEARSSCGGSRLALLPPSTPPPMAGTRFGSGAWASPTTTSTAMAIPTTT